MNAIVLCICVYMDGLDYASSKNNLRGMILFFWTVKIKLIEHLHFLVSWKEVFASDANTYLFEICNLNVKQQTGALAVEHSMKLDLGIVLLSLFVHILISKLLSQCASCV